MDYKILMREGENWRQYLLVGNERVYVVHMVPAVLGWNLGRVDKQGAVEWPNMSRDAIVAWKMHNDDGRTKIADISDEWRARLISYAEAS